MDWAIVAFTVALAIWGYRQGLIVGALTLLGFGLGAFAGSRLGQMLLADGDESRYAPLCGALGALLVGALGAVALERVALGLRERLIRSAGLLHRADGAGGAALIASLALGLAWVFGAVALHAPATERLRADLRASVILRGLNDVMPSSTPVLDALDQVGPATPLAGPPTPAVAPNPAIAGDPDVAEASHSVVRVLGTACGLGIEGSGWAVRPRLVVTNAHVIAGSADTTVTTLAGVELDAVPVYYDPDEDVALLRVGADLPTLGIAREAQEGEDAAVLGYPENGPFTVTPARLGETRSVISENSYGSGPVERQVSSLRGTVRSGNSGGPIVDSSGSVLGTVFAATTSGPAGGFAIPTETVAKAVESVRGPVESGPCVS